MCNSAPPKNCPRASREAAVGPPGLVLSVRGRRAGTSTAFAWAALLLAVHLGSRERRCRCHPDVRSPGKRRFALAVAAVLGLSGCTVVAFETISSFETSSDSQYSNTLSYSFVSESDMQPRFVLPSTNGPADRSAVPAVEGVAFSIAGLEAPFWPWRNVNARGSVLILLTAAEDFVGHLLVALPRDASWTDYGTVTTGPVDVVRYQDSTYLKKQLSITAGEQLNIEINFEGPLRSRPDAWGRWEVPVGFDPLETMYHAFPPDSPLFEAVPSDFVAADESLPPGDATGEILRPDWLNITRGGPVTGFDTGPSLVGHSFSSWRPGLVTVHLENRLARNLGSNANSVFFLFVGGLFAYLLTDRRPGNPSESSVARAAHGAGPLGGDGAARR
jgi:hypothetical protein